MSGTISRSYGRYTVECSNPGKHLDDETGLRKRDLLDYYERIADYLLPHLENRPLTTRRFPDGIDADGFFQKAIESHAPDWVSTVEIPLRTRDERQEQIVADKMATLAYLGSQAAIELHRWLSRADRLDDPDLMVFDLDPPDDDFDRVRRAARQVRELLDELELPAYLLLTGSRGAHVVVPLDRSADFDTVRSLATGAAKLLARRYPAELTTAVRKRARGDRLYLDVARNAYGQTSVAPYSLRALPGAPVATPIDWRELGKADLVPRSYTVRNIFRRLGQRGDPWANLRQRACSAALAADRLRQLSR